MASPIAAAVLIFCKINTGDATLVGLVNDAINIALYDVAREKKWPELQSAAIVTVSSLDASTYTLPSNFMILERVRYSTSTRTWRLYDRQELIPPAPVFGCPRAYNISGTGEVASPYVMTFEPIPTNGSDHIKIEYYGTPTLYDGTIGTRSNMWDAEIQKRAIHYVLTFMGQLEKAKEMWATTLAQMQQATQNATATV